MAWPITKEDVRKALNYRDDQYDDAELDLYARAAMERVEEEVGPMRGQTFSSTVTGPTTALRLGYPGAVVTSIVVDGVTIAVASYSVDAAAGFVIGSFGRGRITVTYTVQNTAPVIIELSCRELAGIWYRQAHGPGGRQQGDFTPLGFAIPREIDEKLEPFRLKKLPGIG
jgi:hypothetical protein